MPDLSKKEKEFLLRKHAITKKLREEFIKEKSNPHRYAIGEGGIFFDPAVARFEAMRLSHYDHFKPTVTTVSKGLLIGVLPMLIFGYLIKTERDIREQKIRNGEVAYKDRKFKFI